MEEETPFSEKEARGLRALRVMVTVLTATMIVGILAILGLLVIRLQGADFAPSLVLPESITLPSGTTAVAVTTGPDWYAVVTAKDEILVFNRADGALRQTIQITPGD